MQEIVTFLKQDSGRTTIDNTDQIAEVGHLILWLEEESSTIAFWSRLGLIRLATWFKDWSEDQAIRDNLALILGRKSSDNPKGIAMRAMNAFMAAMYGSPHAEKESHLALSKLRKKWGRRRREGFRWLTIYKCYAAGILLLPLFVFEIASSVRSLL